MIPSQKCLFHLVMSVYFLKYAFSHLLGGVVSNIRCHGCQLSGLIKTSMQCFHYIVVDGDFQSSLFIYLVITLACAPSADVKRLTVYFMNAVIISDLWKIKSTSHSQLISTKISDGLWQRQFMTYCLPTKSLFRLTTDACSCNPALAFF